MPNTMPEGVTPPPAPYPTPAPTAGPRTFIALVSVISALVGIVIGMSAWFGGLGKAFYVERPEYVVKNEQDTRDKTTVTEALRGISSRLDRQDTSFGRMENSIERLTADLQAFKVDVARRLR